MSRRLIIPTVIALTLLMVGYATWRDAHSATVAVGSPGRLPIIESTTRDQLTETVRRMDARLKARPDDADAVTRLVEALIRLQRVNSDPAAAVTAERHLRQFLSRTPGQYEAQQMLGVALLSQHRFADAIREAERARAIDPADAFNYGVIGDGYLELGDYDKAFEAFDRMGQLRPGPPAYARVGYALELKGELEGALASMRMAADGTTSHDAEGQAWHYAQLGNLHLQLGRLGDAKREFERAEATFPDHPYALAGLNRVKIAEGDYAGALAGFERLLGRTATPELAAIVGDLHARLGRTDIAEQHYESAERLEREGWQSEEPQPQALARFLSERNRKIPEAVRLAEDAATRRRDIHTMDALAWSYFKAGRLDDASRAADAATRTGTRDLRIVVHAAAIHLARGDADRARNLLAKVPENAVEIDPLPWMEHGRVVASLPQNGAVGRTSVSK